MSLFPLRRKHRDAAPRRQHASEPVSVTPAERERAVIDNDPAPLAFDPDPNTAATIRTHLWLQRNASEVTP